MKDRQFTTYVTLATITVICVISLSVWYAQQLNATDSSALQNFQMIEEQYSISEPEDQGDNDEIEGEMGNDEINTDELDDETVEESEVEDEEEGY